MSHLSHNGHRRKHSQYLAEPRLRYSRKFNTWADEEAARLNVSRQEVFNLLNRGNTPASLEQMAAEPVEPENP